MKTQTRVVVIGGGVIGCSILYHLAVMGWKDVVLLEKNELTSGSTWLAAGNTVFFSNNKNLNRFQTYCVEKNKTLEKETGQATDWHETGSIRLAYTNTRMDEFRHVAAKDPIVGIKSRVIDLDEMKSLYPLLDTKNLVGGLYHEGDGHVDPASLTHAFAKGARQNGAEIYQQTLVEGIEQKANGEWLVKTNKGDIIAEYVINAAGLWARDIGRMVGLELPIIPMEHQHILFEDMPGLDNNTYIPSLRDPDISYYLRQEHNALLIGPYEPFGLPWKVNGVENSYASSELTPDLDRIAAIVEDCTNRVPGLQEVGIKHIANGPITYTPDGAPLVGPAFGLKNFFLAAGFSYGITLGAGTGKCLAEWIIEGEPEWDILYMHPQRFGAYANQDYTIEKSKEVYRMEYALFYPHEQREAGRPSKTSPIYSNQAAAGAKFGCLYGWERPEWFAEEGQKPEDDVTLRRANFFDNVKKECLAVRDTAGLLDLSAFAKYEVSGSGAGEFLNGLICGRLPKEGRISVTQMLKPSGNIHSDITVTCLGKDRYYVVCGALAERHDYDWIVKHLPEQTEITVKNITNQYGSLVLAGPESRNILQKLTETNMENAAFPFFTMQEILVAGVPVRAMRLNFVGELGWELHHAIEHQHALFAALMETGKDFGLRLFGMRAMNSMRLEKGYGGWGVEFTPDVSPLEANLERFVLFNKEFIGKEALQKQQKDGVKNKLVTLLIQGNDDTDPYGDEALFLDGKVVGRITSGGYGHRIGSSIALASVQSAFAEVGTKLNINLLGDTFTAEIVGTPAYDFENTRMRS